MEEVKRDEESMEVEEVCSPYHEGTNSHPRTKSETEGKWTKLTSDQRQILENEFLLSIVKWDRDRIRNIAEKTGLPDQVVRNWKTNQIERIRKMMEKEKAKQGRTEEKSKPNIFHQSSCVTPSSRLVFKTPQVRLARSAMIDQMSMHDYNRPPCGMMGLCENQIQPFLSIPIISGDPGSASEMKDEMDSAPCVVVRTSSDNSSGIKVEREFDSINDLQNAHSSSTCESVNFPDIPAFPKPAHDQDQRRTKKRRRASWALPPNEMEKLTLNMNDSVIRPSSSKRRSRKPKRYSACGALTRKQATSGKVCRLCPYSSTQHRTEPTNISRRPHRRPRKQCRPPTKAEIKVVTKNEQMEPPNADIINYEVQSAVDDVACPTPTFYEEADPEPSEAAGMPTEPWSSDFASGDDHFSYDKSPPSPILIGNSDVYHHETVEDSSVHTNEVQQTLTSSPHFHYSGSGLDALCITSPGASSIYDDTCLSPSQGIYLGSSDDGGDTLPLEGLDDDKPCDSSHEHRGPFTTASDDNVSSYAGNSKAVSSPKTQEPSMERSSPMFRELEHDSESDTSSDSETSTSDSDESYQNAVHDKGSRFMAPVSSWGFHTSDDEQPVAVNPAASENNPNQRRRHSRKDKRQRFRQICKKIDEDRNIWAFTKKPSTTTTFSNTNT